MTLVDAFLRFRWFHDAQAAPGEALSLPGRMMSAVSAPPKRVVVVDDTRPVVVLCVNVLRDLGFSVKGTSRGEDALALQRDEPIDLLLIDYKMPGMTGLDVLAKARELQPSLLSILVTGEGTPAVEREAWNMGVDAILLKPFTPRELRAVVEQVLGGDAGGRSAEPS
jgi:DNA-binding response OmpR family regulator